MVTFVGTQSDFGKAVQELVELEYDVVEAYEAAINRLENKRYKSQLEKFRNDLKRHIQDFSKLLALHDIEAPKGPSMGKQWLEKGKVLLANIVSDNAILRAMKSNEEDACKAYERLHNHEGKWREAESLLLHCMDDERQHSAWLTSALKA